VSIPVSTIATFAQLVRWAQAVGASMSYPLGLSATAHCSGYSGSFGALVAWANW
jgi:hypothetical protein